MMYRGFLIFVAFLLSCNPPAPSEQLPSLADQSILAVIYQQRAAENRMLQKQAYKLARKNLDMVLAGPKPSKKMAVVVDIDETVLDNSPYQAKLIMTQQNYASKTWDEWCLREAAKPIPGSVEFLNDAVSKGVDVFYISNRRAHLLESTRKNLEAAGFPQVADTTHILLRRTTSSKVERRARVSETHEIVILMGDNLGDFTHIFEKKPMLERNAMLTDIDSLIGEKYIALPNPTYGDWDGAVFNYNWSASLKEKTDARKNALITY